MNEASAGVELRGGAHTGAATSALHQRHTTISNITKMEPAHPRKMSNIPWTFSPNLSRTF